MSCIARYRESVTPLTDYVHASPETRATESWRKRYALRSIATINAFHSRFSARCSYEIKLFFFANTKNFTAWNEEHPNCPIVRVGCLPMVCPLLQNVKCFIIDPDHTVIVVHDGSNIVHVPTSDQNYVQKVEAIARRTLNAQIAEYKATLLVIESYLKESEQQVSCLGPLESKALAAAKTINDTHQTLTEDSPFEMRALFFKYTHMFEKWNLQHQPPYFIERVGLLPSTCTFFPHYQCSVMDPDNDMLLVCQESKIYLADIEKTQKALAVYPSITFRGFDITIKTFTRSFTAATGVQPIPYPGGSPRETVTFDHVMKSTAVAPGSDIPLHQECSATLNPPQYIAFLCNQPAKSGGETTFASAQNVTRCIKEQAPDIWEQLEGATLTYTMRLLPNHGWRTSWTKFLNPSHATVSEFFNTTDKGRIERICTNQGLTLTWNEGWAIVERSGIPATKDGFYHAQIHTDILSAALCGGKFKHLLAKILLYPSQESRQYGVRFSDGSAISEGVAGRLVTILKKCEIAPKWEKDDLRIQANLHFHGKKKHRGPRELFVVMG